jgi:type I restriction enzyme S subunit
METETSYTGDYEQKYVVEAGDLLIGMDGEFGCYEWKGKPALLNQRVCRLQNFKTVLLPHFIFYGINSHLKDIEEVTGFTTVKHLSSKQVLDIDFPIPPLPEQQRIVSVLDEAFDGIATAATHAKKNLNNARALFESTLQSVFTTKGAGWREHTLKEMSLAFGRGKSKHRPRNDPKLYGGKYPFIQTGDIRNANHLITKYTQTYNENGLAQSKLWARGTLCITIAANIAETAILDFDSCFPDSVIGFVADPSKSDVHFVEYLLTSFKTMLQAKGKGSAQDNINLATFENERFPFPPLQEQQKIIAKLDDLSAETKALEAIYRQKLEALEELKKSILHQAFSGQLHQAKKAAA